MGMVINATHETPVPKRLNRNRSQRIHAIQLSNDDILETVRIITKRDSVQR